MEILRVEINPENGFHFIRVNFDDGGGWSFRKEEILSNNMVTTKAIIECIENKLIQELTKKLLNRPKPDTDIKIIGLRLHKENSKGYNPSDDVLEIKYDDGKSCFVYIGNEAVVDLQKGGI